MNDKQLEKAVKREYPFIVYKESKTNYYILEFIDIPNCYVQGDSLQEVIDLKDEIKISFLKGLYEVFKKLPEPTDLSEVGYKNKRKVYNFLQGISNKKTFETNEINKIRQEIEKKYPGSYTFIETIISDHFINVRDVNMKTKKFSEFEDSLNEYIYRKGLLNVYIIFK